MLEVSDIINHGRLACVICKNSVTDVILKFMHMYGLLLCPQFQFAIFSQVFLKSVTVVGEKCACTIPHIVKSTPKGVKIRSQIESRL